jgi:protein-tyrosine-phosphatase
MNKIIFVCTGNTCRSPMAEKLGQKIAHDRNIQVEIVSRGVSVSMQDPAHERAMCAMEVYELNLKNHNATQFTDIDCLGETLYLTMTLQHKSYLLQQFPQIKGKVFTIKEVVNEKGDIVDPYNKSQSIYDFCAQEIYSSLIKIFDMLQEEFK